MKNFFKDYFIKVITAGSQIWEFLGIFTIKISSKKKINLIIMQNIDSFPLDLIYFKFDLKMSSIARQ